jgi:RHS repeat-associated protein
MRVGTGGSTTGLKWLLTDHLGSTSITADGATGAKLSELRYKPWGELRYASQPTTTGLRFTGQRMEGIGLYDYGARWYDSSLGRWAQPDSIVPEAVQGVQAWDRYAYSNNSPVVHNDPTGHCVDGVTTAFCIAVAVGAITGGVASAAGYIAAAKISGQEINVKSLAVATGAGVVAGALAPIIAVTAPVAAVIPTTLAMYGTVSATQYVVDQAVNDQPVDPIVAVANFGVAAATGIIGGVYSPFDEIGREGMSQGLKLGMDFGKQTMFQGEKETAQEFIRYEAITGASNFARTFTTSLLQTVAPKIWERTSTPNKLVAQ